MTDFGFIVWEYTQKAVLDLLSGDFNQDTIGVLLVIGGLGLLFLLYILTVFTSSKTKLDDSNNMMSALTTHSVIHDDARPELNHSSDTSQSNSSGLQILPEYKKPDNLKTIETNMKALKELYQAGKIKADLYVSESKHLYEMAKNIYSQ